jgi:cell wall-associated NlpC family hydrolase
MQKFIAYLLFISVVANIVACKSVHKITNTDNSANAHNRKKTKREVKFIDGIEITPGSIVKSKHKPSTTKTNNADNSTEIANEIPASTSKINVENISAIQIKYALMLDTYIENMTNKKLFEVVDDWWATNYCMGGTSKHCIDCSGFTAMLTKEIYKINLPRTAAEQYNFTQRVNRDNLKEGDLVFFYTHKGYVSHVGVYLYNNKFVHASTSKGVMISDLNETYWHGKYAGAGKIVE